MIIPKEAAARWAFFEDLTQKCNASRGERRRNYQSLRNYYMYGCDGSADTPARYNKIYPHIDQLTSFLYSQETTRFSTELGVSVPDGEMRKLPSVNKLVNDSWHNSNMDLTFGNALIWSLVYGSTFVKPRWRVKGIEPFVVDPHNFGVLREDCPMISNQEAFTHSYYITRSQLNAELEAAKHPRRETIMAGVTGGPKQNAATLSPIDRIITSASQPVVIGNVDFNLALVSRYRPKVSEDLTEMTELYVWNDETNDYQVVTLAEPYECVFDRPLSSMFLTAEPPFIQVCPVPAYDYFFGFSEVERLIPIQQLLNDRWEQLRHMMALQAHPPKNFSGFSGITDEIAGAFDTPGATVQSEMPGAKVEIASPTIPDDLFREVDRLEQMFEDTSGINGVMQGKGEQGVRSSGHASQLARLGSSRVKKRALIVEDSLEKVATVTLLMHRKYDKRSMRALPDAGAKAGETFIADQFTDDCVVKVDAHSNSPIFLEDQQQLAFELLKVGAITKERLLELTQIPMKAQLLNDLRTKIEPAEQEHAKQEHDDKILEINAKAGRRHA